MIAQVFGIGAMISLFLIYQQKSRKGILICKLSADVFWIAHYFCLGAVAGMIPNFVGVFRETVFLNRKTKRWASSPVWVAVFILFNFSLGIASFKNWYDMIPIIASSFVTVSLWIDSPNLTKSISLPVSASFLTYDVFVGSYIGILNESISILSILLYFFKHTERASTMNHEVFSKDIATEKELILAPGLPIRSPVRTISSVCDPKAIEKGKAFAHEIEKCFVADFEKSEDKMAHVSTFIVVEDVVYLSYYANTKEPSENPENQTARLAFARLEDMENKTFFDLQTAGDVFDGKKVEMVYDTILMKKDEDTLYVMWAARVEGNYYRFYCPFTISTQKFGEVGVNRLKIGSVVNDFSTSGIQNGLAAGSIPCKKMYADIGIMQKQSSRMENGELYYYSGMYSGDFTTIIKSKDLITWEYVSQPDFPNDSQWENATYVWKDKVYYFVRQQGTDPCGFLTVYDLKSHTWAAPVEIEDCQSRSDFIVYRDRLFLFHAPIDREHIGIVEIDTENIANSRVVLQAKMPTSCFYPFVSYYRQNELAMSYTVARQHIRLAEFTLSNYLD